MDIYEEVDLFYTAFSGEKRIIGQSEEGRNLYAFRIGQGGPLILSQSAIHGREWITAKLSLAHLQRGLMEGSAWIVPLVNPDGAVLSQTRFPLWKANAKGVDLNVNFPAKWGMGKENVRIAGSADYIGDFPLCARESSALAAFTRQISPVATLSWHTKGEEIYWYFGQTGRQRARDKRLAEMISKKTGYALRYTPGSTGGYKDWCIAELGIPSFTIEVGADRLPHPIAEATEIISRCIDVPDILVQGIKEQV